jgi:spore coat polysaccharide biosynthesis protein SpsF
VTEDRSRVAIVVVARMTSSRLPGKSLMMLAGETLLGRVLQRTRQSREADCIIVATTSDPSDDPIEEWCISAGVHCFRGSLTNVALRVFEAARTVGAYGVVRVSADSPFIDPALIDYAIQLFRSHDADLVTNVFPRTFPKGESIEVIAADTLEHLLLAQLTPNQQEHVTKVFYDFPERFVIICFTVTDFVSDEAFDYSRVQLSIDTDEDWVNAVEVSELMGEVIGSASWLDIQRAWRQVVGELK